jgi:predicted PurR-regulated permease PerM
VIHEQNQSLSFARRTMIVVGIVAAVVIVALLLVYAADVALLAFAGILLAVLFRGMAADLSAWTGLPMGWSLVLVLVGLALVLGLGTWLLAGQVAQQAVQISEQLPRSLEKLRSYLQGYPGASQLLAVVPSFDQWASRQSDVLTRITGWFSGALGILANLVVVTFIGLYAAWDPCLYRCGLVRLVPLAHRQRAWEVLAKVGDALRGWLRGRLFAMVVVGFATTFGLWLLGSPLALALGLLAAVLGFVPYIGPVVAAAPAVLLAFMSSPQQAIYVALLFLVIQMIEGNVLTPLVQQHSVHVPPALTIAAMVLFGVLLGIPGLILAMPLTAAALVLVKTLYVEDILGDDSDVPLDDPSRREPRGNADSSSNAKAIHRAAMPKRA